MRTVAVELPLEVTDAEIEYTRSLVPSLQSGTLEPLDPNNRRSNVYCLVRHFRLLVSPHVARAGT